MITQQWIKTLHEHVFPKLSEEELTLMLQYIDTRLEASEKLPTKVWSSHHYYNSICFYFFLMLEQINNKPAIFLALLFKNLKDEGLGCISSENNIKLFKTFNSRFNVTSNPSVVSLLSGSEYSDVVLTSDFSIYRDILLLQEPVEILPGVYGSVIWDSSFTYRFKDSASRGETSPEELKSLIPLVLEEYNKRLECLDNQRLIWVFKTTAEQTKKTYNNFKTVTKK